MARRFVFKLQPVLEQRKRVEQEHQLRVAELERERLGVEDRLREVQAGIIAGRQTLRDELGGTGGGSVVLDSVRLQASSSLHLLARAQQIALELAGVHKRLGAERERLIRATSDRKAVELLRQKRYDEFVQEQKKKEQTEMDEMTVMRHARRGADV